MSAGHPIVRRSCVLVLLATSGLLACGFGDRSEAQPNGPVGLLLLDRVPLAAMPALDAMSPDDRRGATLVAAQVSSDYVTVQRGSAPPDSLQLPRLRRRGAGQSVPLLTRFLDDSLVAVVHADADAGGMASRGKYYLSLVNLRQGRVCLDLPLPVAYTGRHRLEWRGDTLTAYGPAVDGPGGVAERVRLRLDVAACPWNYVARTR